MKTVPAKVLPITPDQVGRMQAVVIPSEVIEAVNELIAINFDGSSATVLQKDITVRALDKMMLNGKGVLTIDFNYKWLNFEKLFEDAGWIVKYDKPAFNEDYEPSFTFKPQLVGGAR